MNTLYTPARLFAFVLLVLVVGAAAPALFAQVSIPAGGFTTVTVCTSSTLALPTGCLVATNGNSPTTTGGVLRLTDASAPTPTNQVASAWAVTPQTVANGFSTTFTFQFTTSPSSAPADGIAFVIQNAPTGLAAIGYTGGNGGPIGYGGSDANGVDYGIPNSLAIEFDTYANTWDPINNHVAVQSCGLHINTSHHTQNCDGSVVTDGYGNSNLGINPAPGIPFATDGKQHIVTIQYNPPGTPCASSTSPTNNLCIYLDQSTHPAPVLTAPVDLSTIGLTNGTAYVGFTAATGGSFETQDILSWSFSQTVSAPLVLNGPTPLVFNNNPTQQIVQTVDFTGVAKIDKPITDPQIQSTNVVVSTIQWPPYVVGTPYAVSLIFPKDGDALLGTGTGPFGSIFKDQCFNSTTPPADANCPSVDVTDTTDFISITDAFAFVGIKTLNFQPGTTVGILEYFAKTTPTSDWNPSLPPSVVNPVCTSTVGTSSNPAPASCDLNDIFVSLYGDGGGGTGKTKTKGTFALAYDIPMPLTTLSVNGTTLNNPPYNTQSSASRWFNKSPLTLGFVVNPASIASTPTCPASPPAPCNNFYTPAPVASETYQFTDLSGKPVSPTSTPAQALPAPATTLVQTVAFPGSQNPVALPDGQYFLQYSAADNVGIVERNVQVITSTGANCTNPIPPNTPFTAPCYNTSLFQSQVNVDTTPPTGTIALPGATTISGLPNAFLMNQAGVSATISCNDPYPGTVNVASGQVPSGVQNCISNIPNAQPQASVDACTAPGNATCSAARALSTAAVGPSTISLTGQDVAGNPLTPPQPVTYNIMYEPIGTSCLGDWGHQVLAPFDSSGSGKFKFGKSIPIKFRVCDAKGSSIGTPGLITNIAVQMQNDAPGDTAEDIADAIEDANFHFDTSCQAWVYNMRTRDKERNVLYIFTLTLNDNSTISFQFGLK